jgi:hypothetical protein
MRLGLLALIFFCATNCFLVSEQMIGGETAVFADTQLPGLWRAEGKPAFFLVLGHKDGTLSFHFFEHNFQADSEFYAGKATKTGGETFLNVRLYKSLWENPSDMGYIPAHYKIEGDRLTVAIFNTAEFDRAIVEKHLKGVAAQKSVYGTAPTRLSGTGDEIAKFILDNLKKNNVLDKPAVFRRVKIDTTAL